MSDKLISANKLMEYINGSIEAMTKVGVAVDGEYLWGLINYAIEDAPTIEAEPIKHGYWTKVGDNSYKCSVCGEISCCAGDYCSDCGARMDEEEDEDEVN